MHTLTDGTRVLIRPLLSSDRGDIAAGYLKLSDESRRLRFFSSPRELSGPDLDYLVNLDYRDHFAWAAFALDAPGRPGIGVARYIRLPDRPDRAEVAVTVLDDFSHRGLGSLLLVLLAGRARSNGVHTFVVYARWDNEDMIEGLIAAGARVEPDEPGVARLEIDLPEDAGAQATAAGAFGALSSAVLGAIVKAGDLTGRTPGGSRDPAARSA